MGGKGEGTTQGTDAHIHIGVSPFHSYHNFSHNQERDRGREGGCGGGGEKGEGEQRSVRCGLSPPSTELNPKLHPKLHPKLGSSVPVVNLTAEE